MDLIFHMASFYMRRITDIYNLLSFPGCGGAPIQRPKPVCILQLQLHSLVLTDFSALKGPLNATMCDKGHMRRREKKGGGGGLLQ